MFHINAIEATELISFVLDQIGTRNNENLSKQRPRKVCDTEIKKFIGWKRAKNDIKIVINEKSKGQFSS